MLCLGPETKSLVTNNPEANQPGNEVVENSSFAELPEFAPDRDENKEVEANNNNTFDNRDNNDANNDRQQ